MIVMLALGQGANAAMFGMTDRVLLQLPARRAARVQAATVLREE